MDEQHAGLDIVGVLDAVDRDPYLCHEPLLLTATVIGAQLLPGTTGLRGQRRARRADTTVPLTVWWRLTHLTPDDRRWQDQVAAAVAVPIVGLPDSRFEPGRRSAAAAKPANRTR
jgi:hypothetical protein